jgi:phenylalanyl-tRNA synthetase beta chain
LRQPRRLAGLVYGSVDAQQWGVKERLADFFDIKGDVEALLAPLQLRFVPAQHPALHPGRSAQVELDGHPVGFVGELHPRWRQAYELPQSPLLFELDLDALLKRPVPVGQSLPKHPAAQRDLAVVVQDSVSHEALMAAIHAAGDEIVREARLFDVYRPAGADERSLAVRLTLQDDAATLTDARIDAAIQAVLASLQSKVSARLRA